MISCGSFYCVLLFMLRGLGVCFSWFDCFVFVIDGFVGLLLRMLHGVEIFAW